MDISIASHIDVNEPIKRVYLWGMMGVGKSTYAKQLAKSLGWNEVDLDDKVEELSNLPIQQIFEEYGVDWFRNKEKEAIECTFAMRDVVVSVGGGTPHYFDNASEMKQRGLCIWLDAPIGMLVERLVKSKTSRPLISGLDPQDLRSKLESLYKERKASYAQAHMIISVNNMTQNEGVALINSIIRDKS